MAHKKSSSPSSGADAAGVYGVDWNKLIDHLERNTSITDPFIFNVDEHVFKHSTAQNGDILTYQTNKFNKLSIGTVGQYLKVSAGGLPEWASDSISLSFDDLTDVVNTSPQRGHIIEHDGSNYVNKASPLFGEKTGRWLATGDTTADGLLNGSLVATSTIAIADVNNATYGHGKKFSDGTTTTPYGLKQQLAAIYRRDWNTRIRALVSPSTNGNQTCYVGFANQSTNLPTSSDLLNALQGVLVIAKNGVTNLDVAHNDGTGVTVNDTTGVAYSSLAFYDIEVVLTPANVKVYIGVNGATPTLTNTITTELPAAATDLYPFIMAYRHGGSTKEFDIFKVFVGTK